MTTEQWILWILTSTYRVCVYFSFCEEGGQSFTFLFLLLLQQVPCVRACVRRRVVWLPGEEGPAYSQRSQEVLQADHIRFGFLPQPFHLVGYYWRIVSETKVFVLHVVIFWKLMSSAENLKKAVLYFCDFEAPLYVHLWVLAPWGRSTFHVTFTSQGICCH